ncbi:hypothetical protein GCM10020219_022480 [Nonomuraea dietziae]
MEHLTPGTATYTLTTAVRLRGPLDEERLRAALDELPRRHESLRHRFPTSEDGLPAVHVAEESEAPLALATAADDEEALALIDAAAAVPLDLAEGPLLRRSRCPSGAPSTCSRCWCTTSWPTGSRRSCSCGTSWRSTGRSREAPTVRYGDVALWQSERSFERELAYWARTARRAAARRAAPRQAEARRAVPSKGPPTCTSSTPSWSSA